MSVGYMNVDIKASVHDFEKTRGLCGYFNGKCDDDLRLRDNTQSTHSARALPCSNHGHTALYPNDYSNSWRYLYFLAFIHDQVICK